MRDINAGFIVLRILPIETGWLAIDFPVEGDDGAGLFFCS